MYWNNIRTGSITKLQKAMGHSSINVSLTYLRGLEIAELKEEDIPNIKTPAKSKGVLRQTKVDYLV